MKKPIGDRIVDAIGLDTLLAIGLFAGVYCFLNGVMIDGLGFHVLIWHINGACCWTMIKRWEA